LSLNPVLVAGPKVVVEYFPYVEQFGMTESAANVGASRTYRLNDIYDPDQTGVGTTAFGLTAWSRLYSRFLIKEVLLEVTFVNSTALTDVTVGFVFNPETTALPSAVAAWFTSPRGVSRQLGPAQSSACRFIFRRRVRPHDYLGVNARQYMDDPDFYCTALASPARVLYGQVFCTSLTSPAIVNGTFKATYVVQCFKPVLQPNN